MNSRFNKQCVTCILNRFIDKAPDGTSEADELDYIKGVLKIIADTDIGQSAPETVAKITAYKNRCFGFCDDFADVKEHFNRLMLSKAHISEELIAHSADPLTAALKTALIGNYIDFGALKSVDEARLEEMMKTAETVELDKRELSSLYSELEKAENLVYLTDNCGEIVLDKLFLAELGRTFPSLKITAIVRGAPVLNDATLRDAETVGLSSVAEVVSNGTDIAGTCLAKVSDQALSLINRADVIISKGQGNFETLCGCDLNVYYLFLCKCRLFSERFGVAPCTGMLINDRRLNGR